MLAILCSFASLPSLRRGGGQVTVAAILACPLLVGVAVTQGRAPGPVCLQCGDPDVLTARDEVIPVRRKLRGEGVDGGIGYRLGYSLDVSALQVQEELPERLRDAAVKEEQTRSHTCLVVARESSNG